MPDYFWQRAIILMLLGLGIFFLTASLLGLYYWLAFGAWRPYLGQTARTALVVSIPVTYLIWRYYEQRRGL